MIIEFSTKEECLACFSAAIKEKLLVRQVWSNVRRQFFKTRLFVHEKDWEKFSELFAAEFRYQQLI